MEMLQELPIDVKSNDSLIRQINRLDDTKEVDKSRFIQLSRTDMKISSMFLFIVNGVSFMGTEEDIIYFDVLGTYYKIMVNKYAAITYDDHALLYDVLVDALMRRASDASALNTVLMEFKAEFIDTHKFYVN